MPLYNCYLADYSFKLLSTTVYLYMITSSQLTRELQKVSSMPKEAGTENNSKMKRLAQSGFAAALCLFVSLNLFLAAFVPLDRLSPSDLPKKNSWECHRALQFVSDSSSLGVPEVVLFGSSLMMIPSTCAEADYLNKVVDPVIEPYSYLMDNLLKANSEDKGHSCFNFALPGAMISDHYMVSKSLFNQERKIKLAVLGISLRDFIDCSVDCAAATPAYNYFQRYFSDQELEEMLPLSMPSIANRGEYLVNKYFYLFGKRLELMKSIDDNIRVSVNQTLGALFPQYSDDNFIASRKNNDTKTSITDVDNILSAQDIRPGSYLIPPNMQLPWQDNTREYKKRFKNANQESFVIQSKYLEKMIEHHNRLGIVTMLVNMPLTEANMKLMPEGSYKKYEELIATLSNREDVVLLDLNDGAKFDIKCFRDTVHMNGRGGKLLMAKIADFISSSSSVQDKNGNACTLATKLELDAKDKGVGIAASSSKSM